MSPALKWSPRPRQFSAAKLDAACVAWKRSGVGRRYFHIAHEMGTDNRTLTNWRGGKTVPDGNQLLHLAWFLGVDVADLTE